MTTIRPGTESAPTTIGGRPSTDPRLVRDAQKLAGALGELVRVVQFRDRDRACCFDVTASQCYALKGVVERGPLTVNALAGHLYCDKSTASRLADALQEKGYVERRRDEEDGRMVHLAPTREGSALCAAIDAGEIREYAELLSDFDPAVRSEVNRLVGRLGRCFASSVETTQGSCCVVK